jgi:DNA-binding CsgD family transcriptional regulator
MGRPSRCWPRPSRALSVTEKTVEGHLERAFDKLGVRSRTRLREALREAVPA